MSDVRRLILTRKKRETIVCSVGDTRIVISVNDIRKSDVSITIEAKEDVRILRGELPAALVQEKQEALQGG